jgi:hypothetical protein
MNGKLDYTQFFSEREESTIKLNTLLKGRDMRIGFIEPPDFRENIARVKQGIKELREKYGIQDI